MGHTSDVRDIDIDIVYIVYDELRRTSDFKSMCFNDEEPFSVDTCIETAELHNNKLT